MFGGNPNSSCLPGKAVEFQGHSYIGPPSGQGAWDRFAPLSYVELKNSFSCQCGPGPGCESAHQAASPSSGLHQKFNFRRKLPKCDFLAVVGKKETMEVIT
jgi:hypothetical protein